MNGSAIAEHVERAMEVAHRTHVEVPSLEALLFQYYRLVSPDDLKHRSPADILGAAMAHLRLAQERPVGTASVKVFTPTYENNGWSCGHTVVEVVTDDMPFLVDSVMGELTREGRGVHLLVHPVFAVRRDIAGRLIEVLPSPDIEDASHDVVRESWIHIEIDRTSDDPDEIEARLRRVLSDVREAVEDWPRMRAAAQAAADGLVADPPTTVDPDEAAEAAALLTWLAEDNFTFLGYREYDLQGDVGDEHLVAVPGTGLGILRSDQSRSTAFDRLPRAARAKAREPHALVLTKANSRSTVHRTAYLDYVGVKRFDADGTVIGERRFLGLLAASAYTQSVRDIPVVRMKVRHVLERAGLDPRSHSGKDVLLFLETYPRELLFMVTVEELIEVALAVHHLAERRETRLFCMRDPYGRFMSCLVYLPRDRYTTTVRLRIQDLLVEGFGGSFVEYTTRVSESVLARLHMVVRVPPGQPLPDVDIEALEDRIAHVVRGWDDEFADALLERVGEERAPGLLGTYGRAFPEGYKEDFNARAAVSDVLSMEATDDEGATTLHLYQPVGAEARVRRLKVYRTGDPISLSRVLPVLSSMGVEVVDERPYVIERVGRPTLWMYDFGLRAGEQHVPDEDTLHVRFEEAFMASWAGEAEVDALNALVIAGGLTWQEVAILRCYTRYLRQTGSAFGQTEIEKAVLNHVDVATKLVHLFLDTFDPARVAPPRADAADIVDALDAVESLDDDRILRSLLGMVSATLRTNYFRRDANGGRRPCLSIKLDPQRIPDLPLPRPRFEIWVYSPRVEGVHLRFGHVARGGLRWSDRRADFRTEVLGLVKAQEVKNAVIVPVGAKGGFYAKQLPDPSVDRDAWMAEGKAAYTTFISGLLDITDNLVEGQVVPPPDVVRLDDDDPYLVVAADKGTASFSDLANGVAASYGFWLGDAFASGGSAGYDHKAMGITARGAWESVKRHFRELGIDTQTEDFTAVGIGDMSGDVFGNGMLLSEHIRLVAAFDHRHVFLDPDPDAATSYAERRRLFDLPRSSWADYDATLISEGGGVFPRSAKSIPLTPQVRSVLGISDDVTALVPAELIQRILSAPVQLLWNGGIGTYVKAQTETNVDVGDKANDAVRVNGNDLRCAVVGEGGNLGFTQLGRVEAAHHGVRINSDAIDNSAGVDTSDHEVNLKILLDGAVRDGDLTEKQRNGLLVDMTDEVARLVIRDNYEQNVLLGNARVGAAPMISVHTRQIRDLESRGLLDRALEFLPSDEDLAIRAGAHQGLTSPELAVLAAYSKIALTADLENTSLAEEEWFTRALRGYFPDVMRQRFSDRIEHHPLRARIISTVVVSDLINHGGITLVFRACEESGASAIEVVRAANAAIEVFGLRDFWDGINALDTKVPTLAQSLLHLESRRLLDRATRWFLSTRGGAIDVAAEVASFAEPVRELGPLVPESLIGAEQNRLQDSARRFEQIGAPHEFAVRASAMLDEFALLDIIEVAARAGQDPRDVLGVYFVLSNRYDVDRLLTRITGLPRGDRWTALARQALRSDLYSALAGFTLGVIRATEPGQSSLDRVTEWEAAHAEGISRARTTLDEIAALETADLATLSVALRVLRTLVAQARPSAT